MCREISKDYVFLVAEAVISAFRASAYPLHYTNRGEPVSPIVRCWDFKSHHAIEDLAIYGYAQQSARHVVRNHISGVAIRSRRPRKYCGQWHYSNFHSRLVRENACYTKVL